MMYNITYLIAVLFFAALVEVVRGDDMAFVEVDNDGGMNFRFLDFNVTSKAGIAGFFQSSPMFPHDWMSASTVKKTAEAVFKAASVRSNHIAKQVSSTASDLAPLFASLPKMSNAKHVDALDDGPARYALHRHFSRRHGWWLKGMEPAGASLLIQTVRNPAVEVEQVSRYVLPSYLLGTVRQSTPNKGLELQHLATVVVIIERLVLHDLQEKLFSVFRTLQFPTQGARSKEEIESIVDTFLLTYAFGLNLEISTKRAIEDAKAHLTGSHAAWPKLRNFIAELMQASETPVVDFNGILHFLANDFTDKKYAKWLNQDCTLAKSSLVAAPQMDKGRVPLKQLLSPSGGIRTLFAEKQQDLKELGVLETSAEGHVPSENQTPRLLAANYIVSQALCLTTASAYTICCPNECEDLMERIENTILAPTARPEEVIEAVLEASPALRKAGLDVDSFRAQASDPSDGLVRLHGRPFAGWLHGVLPLECPAPGATAQFSPKTPDEWMQEPSMDQRAVVSIEVQHDSTLAAFTTMGSNRGARDEQPSDRCIEEFPLVKTYPDTTDETEELGGERRGITNQFMRTLRFVCMGGVAWTAFISVNSGLWSTLLRGSDRKPGRATDDSSV